MEAPQPYHKTPLVTYIEDTSAPYLNSFRNNIDRANVNKIFQKAGGASERYPLTPINFSKKHQEYN